MLTLVRHCCIIVYPAGYLKISHALILFLLQQRSLRMSAARRWLERCRRWKTNAVWKLRRSVSGVCVQCVHIINSSDPSVSHTWQQLQVKGQKGRSKQDFYFSFYCMSAWGSSAIIRFTGAFFFFFFFFFFFTTPEKNVCKKCRQHPEIYSLFPSTVFGPQRALTCTV